MDLIRLFKGCVCSSKYKSFLICVRDTKLLHTPVKVVCHLGPLLCFCPVPESGLWAPPPWLGGTALGEKIELAGEVYVRLLFPDFESQKGIRGR